MADIPAKTKRSYNKDAAFQKQVIKLLKDIAEKLEFLCMDRRRQT